MKLDAIRLLICSQSADIAGRIERAVGPTPAGSQIVRCAPENAADAPADIEVVAVFVDYEPTATIEAAQAAWPGTPIVAFGDRDDPLVCERVLACGADDYLVLGRVRPDGVRRALRYAAASRRSEELNRRLLHSDRLAAVGQLAAGVAHEVNNPAAYVQVNLEMTVEHVGAIGEAVVAIERAVADHGDPALTEAVAKILAASEAKHRLTEAAEMGSESLEGMRRIRSIVRDLSTFARRESGSRELVRVNEAVDRACRMVTNEIRHRAQLRKDLSWLPPVAVERAKIEQVLTNLIVNAAHAIEEGRAEDNEIRVTTRHVGNEVVVSVEDTGSGIPENIRARIFDPFFTTKAPDAGTGLGLSLSAEIARANGGDLRFTSEVGRGTRFELVLPCATATAEPQPQPPVAAKVEPVVDRSRARVLIIDDEDFVCRAFRRILAPSHDVVLAAGGEKALELLEGDRAFDVVICDLMMPQVDGPKVYDALRECDPALLERVVFCSGGAFTARVRDFIASIDNQCIEKPVSGAQLRRVIDQVATGDISTPQSPGESVQAAS